MQLYHKTCADINESVKVLTNITNSYEQMVKDLTARMTKVEGQVSELMAKPCKCDLTEINNAIAQMQSDLQELKNEHPPPNAMFMKQEEQINYLRSQQRRNNIIINGIPTIPDENEHVLKNIFICIGNACGMNVPKDSICEIHRINRKPAPRTVTSTSSGNSSQVNTKPTAIFVRFVDYSRLKDELFFKYLELITKATRLTCNAIGLNTNNRIYLNHHLSGTLLQVKDKCVALKKLGVIKNVTSRYNFVKININDTWHKINDTNHLKQTILKECKQDIDILLPHRQPAQQMDLN